MATAIGRVQIGTEARTEGEQVMSAMNVMVKVVVCGVAAMALTVGSGVSFVESTAKAFYASDMATVVVTAKADPAGYQLAQNGTAGLLQ
jgi:hypothetical protein